MDAGSADRHPALGLRGRLCDEAQLPLRCVHDKGAGPAHVRLNTAFGANVDKAAHLCVRASASSCSCVGEPGVSSRPREAADLANSAVGLRPEVEQRRTGLGREEEVTLGGRRREGVRLGVDLLEVALHGQL